jgi:hypothetical protein
MCSPSVIASALAGVSRRRALHVAAGLFAGALAGASRGAAADRTGEGRTIAAGNVLDLTHTLSPAFPIWPSPTNFPIKVTNATTVAKDGYYSNKWELVEHHGTHLDAPAHFAAQGRTADRLEASALVAPAAVIDIRERARTDADAVVTVDDLKAWEKAHGRLPKNCGVFLNSGWDAKAGDARAFLGQEYLPGLSLEELVKRHGPLPPGRAVYLLRQLCQALREAHAVGLIHRDIKPSTIIAARRGGRDDVAKLLDVGLVRPAQAPAADLSAEGQILGTPLFMSPEQAAGDRELDQRSNLYSLGAVAYHLLTGRPPFDGVGGLAVLVAHARDPVVPPSLILTGIPEDLEHVVLRCLAKDAADRFADAESLEQALREYACSGDWDQDRAARWWRDAGRISPSHTTAAAS